MLSGSLGSGGSDQSHLTLYQPYFLHPFFAPGHCSGQDSRLCGPLSLTQKGSYVIIEYLRLGWTNPPAMERNNFH